jgi:predicted secreted protein
MRYIASLPLLLSAIISSAALAQNTDTINYNIVNIQAEASRDVSNDEMHAVLYIEQSNKQPANLATQINQLMNKALASSKKYPNVKVTTGSQNTYPIYDNENRKLKEWRGRAEIRLESSDFQAASQLISELQQDFQTQSINFTVSEQQRKKVENELLVEASKNFQQRAQTLAHAWNKTNYSLVNLNLNTNTQYPRAPLMMSVASAKFSADAIPEQNVSGGESKISVNANGTIQFK